MTFAFERQAFKLLLLLTAKLKITSFKLFLLAYEVCYQNF